MIGRFDPYSHNYSSQLQPWSQSYWRANRHDEYALQEDDDLHSIKYRRQRHRPLRHIAHLQNPRLHCTGDFGWSLGYATAYCFKHLNENRFGVAGAIDNARSLRLHTETAYVIFGLFDKHLFKSKLTGMVFLKFAPMEMFSPGCTAAAGLRNGRIMIQLNRTPFEYETGDIDTLIEMLIHQMIHAYFLVCCGAQKDREKADGRLLDDVQFGVVLETINDISASCRTGVLNMLFHAADRDNSQALAMPRANRSFIALDPTATSFDPGLATGKTCCHRDNRHVRYAQIRNWQVEHYSKALGENWDTRGDHVLFFKQGRGAESLRVRGPPSYTYSELVCQGRRYAVQKDRAQKFTALKRIADDSKHGDIKVPDCPVVVLQAVWQFIQHGSYMSVAESYSGDVYGSGPPVLYEGNRPAGPISLHIRVCRVATAMKFPELQQLAIKHLYTVSSTTEDPVSFLSLLYEPAPAMCMDLQGWSRKFLAKTDGYPMHSSGASIGTSNYEKIISWHRSRFYDELWDKFPAFKDDVRLAVGTMNSSFTWETDNHAPLTGHGLRGGVHHNGMRPAYTTVMLDGLR